MVSGQRKTEERILLPALLLTPFSARSLTHVRSLLLNHTERLATQARDDMDHMDTVTDSAWISKYRIYSINRPGRLLNFWTLRVGAY